MSNRWYCRQYIFQTEHVHSCDCLLFWQSTFRDSTEIYIFHLMVLRISSVKRARVRIILLQLFAQCQINSKNRLNTLDSFYYIQEFITVRFAFVICICVFLWKFALYRILTRMFLAAFIAVSVPNFLFLNRKDPLYRKVQSYFPFAFSFILVRKINHESRLWRIKILALSCINCAYNLFMYYWLLL